MGSNTFQEIKADSVVNKEMLQQKSRFDSWMGILGLIVGIIGIILAFYFYYVSLVQPDLAYYVQPLKTKVVDSNQINGLRIFYGNQEIKGSISAGQIAIWNNGKKSIHPENVLENISISTNPRVKIIQATLLQSNRPNITKLKIISKPFDQGKININWRILERNDGAVVQVVYAGRPDTDLTLNGTIEGQQHGLHKVKRLSDSKLGIFLEVWLIISTLWTLSYTILYLKKRPNMRKIASWTITMEDTKAKLSEVKLQIRDAHQKHLEYKEEAREIFQEALQDCQSISAQECKLKADRQVNKYPPCLEDRMKSLQETLESGDEDFESSIKENDRLEEELFQIQKAIRRIKLIDRLTIAAISIGLMITSYNLIDRIFFTPSIPFNL